MPLFRRSSLPDDVRRSFSLDPGDRVLASAALADDGWVVATRTTLRVSGPTAWSRAWCDVDRAAYDPETSSVTVSWVDDAPSAVLRLASSRSTALLQTVRERVQSSVVLAESLTFAGRGKVRVAVRRDGDGELFSQVVADPGVDLGDPEVAEKVDALEGRVRSASGLPL